MDQPSLQQDPHKLRDNKENNLEIALGREVRAFRHQKHMTVAHLAEMSGISIGMLSKIENGNTSPSLTTLKMISDTLGVPITALFRRYEETREASYVEAGNGVEIERAGTRAGHQYSLLGHLGSNATGVMIEPYLITLTDASDVFPTFQHDGLEFLYMLEGSVMYRHGIKRFRMTKGDALMFDADAPHGPEELVDLPAKFLSIICYPQLAD